MCRLASGLRRPRLALPIQQLFRWRVGHTFPPDIAIRCKRDIGEDDVFLQHRHAVRIGLVRRPRGNAEKSCFRVDGVKAAVLARLEPGDVLAYGRDLPAIEPGRGHDHREIRLAACRRKRPADIAFLAGGRGDTENQHVLGQPAVVAPHDGSYAQAETLFSEQGVAAVAGAERPDLARLGKLNNVLVLLVAGPRHVLLTGFERRPDRVYAWHEVTILAEHVPDLDAHARHDAHTHGDVRGIR